MNTDHKIKASESLAQTGAYTGEDMGEYNNFAVQLTYTDSTPSADNFLAGEVEISTLTFEAQASMDDGEYVVIYDTAGNPWAIAADLTGSSAEPTGAIYTAIPAAQKAQVDLSSATDAASVAAAFEVAFDALTSVPFATDDTAADGTMIFTQNLRGPCSIPVSLLEDDSLDGDVGIAETNQGVASTVDVTANTISVVGHGYSVGLKGQVSTDGTLPSGLAAVTDYFVIVVDEDTIKLASSLVNANAGTAIDITDQGDDGDTHVFTATSLASTVIKMQESIDGENWSDISGLATSGFTADGSTLLQGSTKCNNIRPYATFTAGQVALQATYFKKE